MTIAVEIDTGTLGFPRMGPNRELKFALEKYWRGAITQEQLNKIAVDVETQNWHTQVERGIQRIGVGMFSLYDHVLDWTLYLGCEPQRFTKLTSDVDRYFAMARGLDGIPALDMTKWFDSNYHYEVPELNVHTTPKANFKNFIDTIKRAQSTLGKNKAVPVILGPLTYLALAKYDDNTSIASMLPKLLPLYTLLINQLAALGVPEVQVHEPSLVGAHASKLLPHLVSVYGDNTTAGALTHPNVNLHIATYFEAIDDDVYKWFATSKIAALSLDFTRGDNLSVLQKFGFPSGKRLGVGIVDGRGVWKIAPSTITPILSSILEVISRNPNAALTIQPSSSLQHVPYTTKAEVDFQANLSSLYGVLSFAYEKLDEVKLISNIIKDGQLTNSTTAFQAANAAWATYYKENPAKQAVQTRVKSVTEADLKRPSDFATRRPHQMKSCPILPTTTIGSFPQTAQIRGLRRQLKLGKITQQAYEAQIDAQIAYNIGVQDALGLDILVHGEPERTDMVEFFAEKLNGFAFSQNGWVQSYGSRCVRPPVIYADLERPLDMTVREFKVAQGFSAYKPVKGMLTGPVTILNWSFPRLDITRKEQAYQLALCLRDEVAALEKAGCTIIQVDEPALREGMPLKLSKKDAYLRWAVDAFRLSTAVAANATSIHTHMCYCEFNDCMPSIDEIDADVNSIENARSGDETIRAFKSIGYKKDLGPGVYDIHSPVVPPKDEIIAKLESFLKLLPAKQLVVNPDCGLKTRRWPETIAALKNMVEAAHQVRSSLK
ncbi:5-methlytetrahydropteroyltriglutamate-homocysteine methyltransferease [Thraustotheca clavata]|nr:5-methlytetrahydropteroyltriglutamate-homocysteine methyltransferease [Thraustotheca clavata]